MIREVRDTLYDLRTDVSGIGRPAMCSNSSSTGSPERSGLQIQVDADRHARLPLCRSARCGVSPRRRSPTWNATRRPQRCESSGAATASVR